MPRRRAAIWACSETAAYVCFKYNEHSRLDFDVIQPIWHAHLQENTNARPRKTNVQWSSVGHNISCSLESIQPSYHFICCLLQGDCLTAEAPGPPFCLTLFLLLSCCNKGLLHDCTNMRCVRHNVGLDRISVLLGEELQHPT